MIKELDVFLHDRQVGILSDIGNAQLEFCYLQDYLKEDGKAISYSLPLGADRFIDQECRPFFAGLLPEDNELENLARHLKVSRNNIFKLLVEVGGECAGAVSLYPRGQNRQTSHHNKALSGSELETILLAAGVRPLMGGDEKIRLSLAGAQSKIAVVIDNGSFHLSSPSNPSTHIIKPQAARFEGLVQNEYLWMQLAAAAGVVEPELQIIKVGSVTAYHVQRYDRTVENGRANRIHQEDFCQALAISPENKYESEGGPNLKACTDLILDQSGKPALDYQQLLDRVLFNYLIGNSDAHAKNFSLLYLDKMTRLAPAYDLVCTTVYPEFNQKMAMKIGGRYDADDLQRRHWERLVPDSMTARKSLQARIREMCALLETGLDSVVQEVMNSEHGHPVCLQIENLVRSRILAIPHLT